MLEFRFDFKGTNQDIARFIDFVNTAGKPDILTNSGLILKEKIPGVMSNPLMTMTDFSLQNVLDTDNPSAENSGRV